MNVPFLIGLDIFMEHWMSMIFDKHELMCKKEKWNMLLHYLSGHVYIRPKI